jgi:hypothetical protein
MAITIRLIAITSLVLSRMRCTQLPANEFIGKLLVGSVGQAAAV